MAEDYGMPPGTAINYKQPGFPGWVDALCLRAGLDSSTYPGHQETDRPDIGAAPNPDHLNRGIDWAGDPDHMLDFAHRMAAAGPPRNPGAYGPPGLEMVIYQDPRTGERVWYPDWVDYGGDFPNHTDHVHLRVSASVLDVYPPTAPPSNPRADGYALAVIQEGQRRNVSPRGIQIALAVTLVESELTMYANSNVPESLNIPHDAVGSDHDSVGLFQQRCPMWGPAAVLMDPTQSAGLFYDHLQLLDFDNPANTPGFYAQTVQGSAFPDRYDTRFADATTLFNRLAGGPPPPVQPPQPGDGFMGALTPDEQRALYNAFMLPVVSLSPLRALGQGAVYTVVDLLRNIDGSEHLELSVLLAELGHPPTLALLNDIANADPNLWPDRQDDRKLAKHILKHAEQVRDPGPAPTPTPTPTPPPPTPVPPPQPVPSGGGGVQSNLAALNAEVSGFRALLREMTNFLRG